MFKRIDKNNDGKLQIEELREGLDELVAFFQYEEIDY
jgi:Ca2+-binding EF-hand superfamily protein